jgi:hypothetical protein
MNREELQEILAAFRPGVDDPKDPLFAEAMAAAARDPALKAWLEDSVAFDRLVAHELSQVRPPADLRDSILARSKIVRPAPWWARALSPRQFAAAACFLMALGVGALWLAERPKTFAEFRQDIAMRSWGTTPHLELATADLDQVRRFLSRHNIPADFEIPPALAESLNGCGVVTWRGHRIPYLCGGSQGQHYHVAIAERGLFADAPPVSPQLDRWEAWRTATWSKDSYAYVVTGLSPTAFLKKFRKSKRWDWEG